MSFFRDKLLSILQLKKLFIPFRAKAFQGINNFSATGLTNRLPFQKTHDNCSMSKCRRNQKLPPRSANGYCLPFIVRSNARNIHPSVAHVGGVYVLAAVQQKG